jgi:ubiquinone/menaquinone biosynthesis C-methylase UbiE
VSFNVAADAYYSFMGRYSVLLSPQLADLATVRAGPRALDVGCGPGALTSELVARLGADAVVAADPSQSFVAAARERNPGVEVVRAAAEDLPFGDDTFDVVLAQLVVHFMADPVAGLREMARVCRSGGIVAACVWDHAGRKGPLGIFWEAAKRLKDATPDESGLAGVREGHLAELFHEAGLRDVQRTSLRADLRHATFEEWWEPFMAGVGPAGAYVASLDPAQQEVLRDACRDLLPEAPFVVPARAWVAWGLA